MSPKQKISDQFRTKSQLFPAVHHHETVLAPELFHVRDGPWLPRREGALPTINTVLHLFGTFMVLLEKVEALRKTAGGIWVQCSGILVSTSPGKNWRSSPKASDLLRTSRYRTVWHSTRVDLWHLKYFSSLLANICDQAGESPQEFWDEESHLKDAVFKNSEPILFNGEN